MSLSINLTPGKVFVAGQAVSIADLNAAANPSVSLEGSVTAASLGAGSVQEVHIATGAVTSGKIGAGAVTNEKLGTGAVYGTAIAADAIDSTMLAADAVDAAALADNSVGPAALDYSGTALATSGNITVDWSSGLTFSVTLTDNATMKTFSNPKEGQSIVIAVKQAAAGGKSLTWDAALGIKWRGSQAAPTLTSTASRVDLYSLIYVGTVYYGNFSQNYGG